MLNSSLRFVVVWKTRASILIFSTPGPYSSLSVATMRVFLPAPDGPYTRRWGKSPLCACSPVRQYSSRALSYCSPHKSSETLRKLGVIVQSLEIAWPVFVYKKRHGEVIV